MLKDFDLNNYLFDITKDQLKAKDCDNIRRQLQQEMLEIFNGRNMPTIR